MFRCYQTHSPPGLPVTTLLLRSFEHSSLQFCTSQTLWLVPPKDVYIQPRMALPSSANRTAPQRTSTSTLYLDHHCLLLGKPTCISTRFPLMVDVSAVGYVYTTNPSLNGHARKSSHQIYTICWPIISLRPASPPSSA